MHLNKETSRIDHNFSMKKSFKVLVFVMTLLATTTSVNGYDSYVAANAQTYVLEKLAHNDIVFMGTTHKQAAILDFLADLLPRLHTAGVTHIAVEIASDQQWLIDRYFASGYGLADIDIHQAIDCPRYRYLFDILRGMDGDVRPEVVAIDLPQQLYSGPVNRDAHMAATLDNVFASNSDSKILAILGTFHVFRQLNWNRRVSSGHTAIRTLLSQNNSQLNMFSIAHVLSQGDRKCDFSRLLGPVPGVVAVNMAPVFDQWHLGLTASLAIKPEPTRRLLDGLIVH